MNNLSATITSKKPIIHAYVKRLDAGKFNLFIQTGNALPVFHSEYYCFPEAKEEAMKLDAVSCRLV